MELSLNETRKVTEPLAVKLNKLGDKLLVSNDDRLSASECYTLAPKRESLAKKCFASALTEGRGAADWDDELGMVAMCFSDMFTHMKLAKALLDGNPKKIDQASSMDTATRDNLPNAVWDFVRGDGIEKIESIAPPKSLSKPARR